MIHLKITVIAALFAAVLSFVPKDFGTTLCGHGGPTLVGHPELCQRYYNCSDTAARPERSYLGPYEIECPYPKLFDVVDLRCKSFKEAKCGTNRTAAKDACDYVKNQCLSAHCQECISRLPSCIGLSDGLNVYRYREWSPYYIRCDTERLNGTYTCDRHQPTNTTAFFSPLKLRCVSVWEVPASTGFGLAPSCAGKLNGYYVSKERPDVYYTCPSTRVYYCQPPAVFNSKINRCS